MRRTDNHKDQEMLHQLDQLQSREPLPGIEPPDLVDQAVRNMARRELQNPAKIPLAGNLRWIAGLSTVSIALIALGISLVQSPQLPHPEEPSFKDAAKSPQAESHHVAPAAAPALSNSPPADSALSDSGLSGSAEKRRSEDQATAAMAQDVDEIQPRQKLMEQRAEPTLESISTAELSKAEQDDAQAALNEKQPQSAEAWLDLVHQLHEQGLRAEAAEQLSAFSADYPDYPLPEWALDLQRPQE